MGMRTGVRAIKGRSLGYGASVATVVAATALFLPFRSGLGSEQWGWLFLVVVGAVAWLAGTGPALLAAALAFLSCNFFFVPPYHTLAVADPRDVIRLGVFLLVAGSLGFLTGRLRERSLTALRDEREATALARLATALASGSSSDSIVRTASAALLQVETVQGVVVWLLADSGLEAHGPGARFVAERDLVAARMCLNSMKATGLPDVSTRRERLGVGWPASAPGDGATGVFLPLMTKSGAEGVLQVIPDPQGLAPEDVPLLVSVANLLSVFLAGQRLAIDSARVQAVSEAEQLKAALLSAISHELKTPLVSLTAAVTDLMQPETNAGPAEVRARLLEAGEDIERLNGVIANILDLSRLEADAWLPHKEVYEAGEIIGAVASGLHLKERDRLRFDVPEASGPEVYVDFAQVQRALAAIVDNALRYSPAEQPVVVGADSRDGITRIWVEDRGLGLLESEKMAVFERGYRGVAGMGSTRSTGLGLAIAAAIVRANSGSISVEDAAPHGARFVMALASGPKPGGDS